MAERTYTTYRVRTKRRHWRSVALALAILVGALVGSAAWLARDESGHIPPGIEIAGVDVGGMSLADARSAVEGRAAQLAAEPVALGFEGGRLQSSGEELGAQADIAAVLARAEDSRDRVSRLKARLGFADPITFDLSFTVDPERLDVVLKRLAKRIEKPPVPARVAFVDGEVVTKPAHAGSQLDLEAAAAALSTLPDHVQLTMQDVQPRIGDEAATEAQAAAETLLAGTPTIFFRRTRATSCRRGWSATPSGSGRRPARSRSHSTRRRSRARFAAPSASSSASPRTQRSTSAKTVSPSSRRIGASCSRSGRIAAAVTADPTAPQLRALFNNAKPELTTVGAQKLRIRQLVSEFTTPYPCCASRVTNIQLAAQILDGYVIRPGERFSLNEALGPRTSERGFVSAPMIAAGGRLEDAIGGGVSQVATTFYNAAFFAGLELIEHTPHSFYISRYPMGREATVSWGGPELIFRNDWPVGILVKVTALDTSITVRFYSSKLRRRVETETSEPYNYVAATTQRELNPSLPPGSETVVQGGGVSGFTRRLHAQGLSRQEADQGRELHRALRPGEHDHRVRSRAPRADPSGQWRRHSVRGEHGQRGLSGGGPPQEEPPAESNEPPPDYGQNPSVTLERVRHPPGTSVLPSFLTPPVLAAATWVAVAPYVWGDASTLHRAVLGPIPGGVVLGCALADYVLWRRRGRPWHDWQVIVLLLPAIAAGVWVAVGALVLDAGLTREQLLATAVGPGVALVGLLTTLVSYHGRHHPDEYRT